MLVISLILWKSTNRWIHSMAITNCIRTESKGREGFGILKGGNQKSQWASILLRTFGSKFFKDIGL
jgi:hypothetical protein